MLTFGRHNRAPPGYQKPDLCFFVGFPTNNNEITLFHISRIKKKSDLRNDIKYKKKALVPFDLPKCACLESGSS